MRIALEILVRSLCLALFVLLFGSESTQAQVDPPAHLYLPQIFNSMTETGLTQPASVAETAASPAPIAIPISQPADLAQLGRPKAWQPRFASADAAAPVQAQAIERSPLLPPADRVRWNNDEATACSALFGAGLLANTLVAFLAVPPFDLAPTLAAHAGNVMLMYCGPVVEAPPSFTEPPPGDSCRVELELSVDEGNFSNILGVPSLSDAYGEWGALGSPGVYQFDTSVKLSVQHDGLPVNGKPGYYSFPVGYNGVRWRGETLASPVDFVPIYVPGLGYTRKAKLLRRALQLTLKGSVAVSAMFLNEPFGPYNDQRQIISVTDFFPPEIAVSDDFVVVEATEPGGISGDKAVSQARAQLSVSDHCDRAVSLAPSSTPSFWAIGDRYVITWTAQDPGPNEEGLPNTATAQQTVVVTDTLPPLLVAPPPIVVESPDASTTIELGQPQVFDFGDLTPAIDNNALSLPDVSSGADGLQFPRGKTLVTWSAQDTTGNRNQVSQLVNIKGIGENNAPAAAGDTVDALSFQPISITLQATDVDDDPLWFSIAEPPAHGFFIAPLLPYFIEDYRITARYSPEIAARDGEAKALEVATGAIAMGQYIEARCEEDINTDLPKDFVFLPNGAEYFAVDDQGYTYIYDQYYSDCTRGGSTIYPDVDPRLSLWSPAGLYVGQIDAGDGGITDIKFDLLRGYVFEVSNDGPSNRSGVRVYRIDRDNPDGPFSEVHFFGLATFFPDPNSNQNWYFYDANSVALDSNNVLYALSREPEQGLGVFQVYDDPEDPGGFLLDFDYVGHLVNNNNNFLDDSGIELRHINNLALDSRNNVYVAAKSRIYKFAAAAIDAQGKAHAGDLIGWLGRCDGGPNCDSAHGRSFGYSCTDETCFLDDENEPGGDRPGQFQFGSGSSGHLAVDPNDILYIADGDRIQRFTPQGFFAGQAVSQCDGTCFVVGDFGYAGNIAVNSDHFYVMDGRNELVHIFQASAVTPLPDGRSARVTYQSDNNYTGPDPFTFAATDGLDTDVATVDVQVDRNFRPPVANPFLAYALEEDTSATITLEGDDPDGDLDTLTYRVVKQPDFGKLSPSVRATGAEQSGSGAERLYVPDPNYAGPDTFQYVVEDGRFTSQPATVTLTISNVNDAPQVNLNGDFETGLGFITYLTGTVADADGDMLYLTIDWGDGTQEGQGSVDEEDGLTGPVLNQNLDGNGQFFAQHVYTSEGEKTVEVCAEDNAIIEDGVTKPQGGVVTCATIAVRVLPRIDLTVELQQSRDPVVVGTGLRYRYVVANQRPEGAPGLTATDVVVAGMADANVRVQTPVQSTQGECSHSGGEIDCQLGALVAGAVATVTMDVDLRVGAVPGVTLQHTVTVAAAQPEHDDDNAAVADAVVVSAGDFIVNRILPGDKGDCTDPDAACPLNIAVQQANTIPGPQRIVLGDENYALGEFGTLPPLLIAAGLLEAEAVTTEVLELTDDAEIMGLGALTTTIYGDESDRLFAVRSGATLTLTGLSLLGGKVEEKGGAVLVDGGKLMLQGVTLRDNTASDGGAIYNDGGEVRIIGSALFRNAATDRGGALYNGRDSTMYLENTTISSNRAATQGGGLYSDGSVQMVNGTIAANRAADGGGLANQGGVATLTNSIVAANHIELSGVDCSGQVSSGNRNLLGNDSGCAFAAKGQDRVNQEALIGSLVDNGGATPTHRLLAASPALNTGACTLATDQRGFARPAEEGCDIGAVEMLEEELAGPGPDDRHAIYLPTVSR